MDDIEQIILEHEPGILLPSATAMSILVNQPGCRYEHCVVTPLVVMLPDCILAHVTQTVQGHGHRPCFSYAAWMVEKHRDRHKRSPTEGSCARPSCPQDRSKGPGLFYLLIDMYLTEVLGIAETIASVSKRCQVLQKL